MPPGSGLQATTVVHRVARALRGSRPSGDVGTGRSGRATRGGPRGDVVPGRPPGGGSEPAGDRTLDDVCARAGAAGALPVTVRALADAWPALTARERAEVSRPLGTGAPGPLRLAGVTVRQVDGTTCGSAVLALLAAAGDPVLAFWLVTGRVLPGDLPPELAALPVGALRSVDAGVRVAGLQRSLKRASTRRALGPLPWPAALGTPPWGAARAARYGGVRWTHVLVDDTDAALVEGVLDRADGALAAGVPVPLFTGGDLGAGLAAAVPRHVVLLVPPSGPGPGAPPPPRGYAVYEPGHGRVHRVPRARLVRPGGAHPALGGWSHVCWAVLPA